jgi:hypothetical protein
MHKGFLKNLSRIKLDQLGVLKDCTAVLGKSEYGSIYKLFNGESDNWWWRSISKKELTPDYYAIVLFISHIDYGRRMSIKTYLNFVQNSVNNSKTPVSSTICGIMIGNIVFVKDVYNNQTYKFNFDINTEDNVTIKSIGSSFDNVYFRGIFNLKNCPFYCPISC